MPLRTAVDRTAGRVGPTQRHLSGSSVEPQYRQAGSHDLVPWHELRAHDRCSDHGCPRQ